MVSPAAHASQEGSEDEALHSASRTNTPPASRSSISGVSCREREDGREDGPSSRGSSPISSGKMAAVLALEEGILEESRRQTPDKSSPASIGRISLSSARRSHDWAEGHLSNGG